MPDGAAIIIRREDRETLLISGPLRLARAFFTGDPSSVGRGSFDALAGAGEPDAITLGDIIAINTSMRARSPHRSWADVIAGDAGWLRSIPPDLDLLDLDDDDWAAVGGDHHLHAGLEAVLGPGRGLAVSTKVLHLKRPGLFPVLDSFVAQMLGVNVPPDPTPGQRIDIALGLARAVRREGRMNIEVLRSVRRDLLGEGASNS